MFKVKLSLKKGLMGFLAVAVMMTGMNMTVLADGLTDEDLHAGATAVMKGTCEETEELTIEDSADLVAGAALFLEAQVQDVEVIETDLEEIEEEPSELDTVVMANVKDAVNVRVEPNEEADTVGKLYKNCGGIILERRDGWTLLTSGDLTGWAKDEFLLFGEEAVAFRNEVGMLKATAQTDALRVRKEPNEESGVYTLLELNESIKAIEEESVDGWVAIRVDDETIGYVSADYVEVAFVVDAGKTNEQIKKEEAEREKAKLNKNRGAVSVATSDVTLLAALIQCEAGRESYEGKLAVGAVVMNRVRSASYPNSVSGVINAPSQFPPATNGKVASVVASGPSASCIQAAQAAIDGASNVGGATHFRATSTGATGIVIGNHAFW